MLVEVGVDFLHISVGTAHGGHQEFCQDDEDVALSGSPRRQRRMRFPSSLPGDLSTCVQARSVMEYGADR